MWKYKEFFTFPHLTDSMQQGELEFVRNILSENDQIARTRHLKDLLNGLAKRAGNSENFIILLEIYEIIIDIDSMSSVRGPMLKMIRMNPDMLIAWNSKDLSEFSTSISILEIFTNIMEK